jgi:transposase
MKRIRIKLSQKEEKQLRELLLNHRDRKVYQRFLCIRLLNEGKTNSAVAELLDVSLETIKNWLVIYEKSGLEGLASIYEGMRKSSLNPHSEQIQAYHHNLDMGGCKLYKR